MFIVPPGQLPKTDFVVHLCCRMKFYLNVLNVFTASVNYFIKRVPSPAPQPNNPCAPFFSVQTCHACMKSGGEKLACYSINY